MRWRFAGLAREEQRLRDGEGKVEKPRPHSRQPPSSDGVKPGPAKPRHPGEKPLGGQPGPAGATRARGDTPADLRDWRPHRRWPCGARVDGLPARLGARRPPIERPEPKPVVTAFRPRGVECPGGGRAHRRAFPAGVTPTGRVGPRLKASAGGVVQGHVVSRARTGELIAAPDGVPPSEGAVQTWGITAGP